jgi:hypothetical protein
MFICLPGDSRQELRCQHSLNSHLLALLDDFSVLATCWAARALVASVLHERACLDFFLPVLEQQFGDDDLATAFVGFLIVSWIDKSNGTSQENPNSTPKLILKDKHSGRTTVSSQVASQVYHELHQFGNKFVRLWSTVY